MPAAPIGANEAQRLAAVRRVNLFGTPAEERFDKITRLARKLFDVPMACLDIAGEDALWLKSVQGFDAIEGLRKDSYCHYTVLDDSICLVHDARSDPRVSDSVLANLWVFYAGVPLHFDGERIGVLCIGDDRPREFAVEQLAALNDLAILAERELNEVALSQAQIDLAKSVPELERKSRIDVLTHVWNWDAVLELLAVERATAEPGSCTAVLMVDVDNFKKVNDRYGRRAGDQILRVVAERLRAGVRPMDVVGRYAGEQFLAVLPSVKDDAEALVVAERIRQAISNVLIHFERYEILVTCSIGCTTSASSVSEPIDQMIRRAEQALLRAKAGGRNRVELEDSDSPGHTRPTPLV